ncbi:Ig-like domain-containing protein [Oceanospirillaceae bacterium]|nr:Ig-like domain-containing protein [Oceanospirillaceae bacterium]
MNIRALILSFSVFFIMFNWAPSAYSATYNVTDNNGGNVVSSLHAAIILANANAGTDTITFSASVNSIVLTADLPAITETLTITGPGQTNLTISGNGSYSMFDNQTNGVTFTASDLTLTNSKYVSSGGGILMNSNNAHFVANNITVSGVTNSYAFYGKSANTITISNSTFQNNSAMLFGSDHGSTPSTTTGSYTNKITITSSSFISNTSWIFNTERYVKIDASTFTNNTSGIGYFKGLNRYQVLNSIFTGNTGSTLFRFSNYHLGTGWGSGTLSDYHHLFDGNTFTNNTGTVINPGGNTYYDNVTTIKNNSFGNNGTNWTGTPAVSTPNTFLDMTPPTMTITSAEVTDGGASNDATLALTFTSSEATSNFALGDITISGGTLSSFATTSSTVYTATFTPSGDVATTIDVAGSTFTDSSSNNNTAATQFNWTFDSSSPTMTITSAEVTDGGASNDATLALTFTSSEATSNFALSDIAVTNAALSSFSMASSTVYTATLTPTDEGAITVDVAAGTFTDAASNNNTAATQFNWTYLVDPTTKVDVTGSIKASINMASQWTQSTFSSISNRLGWLKSNKSQSKTSYQGIQLDFNDDTINALMAAPSASLFDTNWTNEAVNQVNRSNDSLSMLESNLVNDVTKAALNEAAIARQNATGTLSPAFKPIYDGWSIWTDGTVTIGDVDATAASAKQSSKDYSISIGVDKPLNDNHLVGYVLRTGQGSVDVGASTSKVKSESYSIAGYSAYEGYRNLLIETVVGVGVVKYNLTRADGVHTLNGGRSANQAFASFSASKPTMVFGKLSLSPFVKATHNYTSFGAYSESGGITALTYKEHAINETQLALGTDARYQLFVGNNNVYPYARVSYSLDVSDQANEPAQMHYNINPSKVYSLALDTRSTASVQLALGADLITMGGINASLGYLRNTVINSGHSQSVSLRIGQAF